MEELFKLYFVRNLDENILKSFARILFWFVFMAYQPL